MVHSNSSAVLFSVLCDLTFVIYPKSLKKFFLIQRQLIELLVFAGFIAKTACVQICRSLSGLFIIVGEMPSFGAIFLKIVAFINLLE